jgi:hypothetical protein
LGGITVGEVLTGKSYSQLFQDLLVPTLYPSLTNPSNSFSFDAIALYEIGAVQSIIFTANFNRGSISPAYGTNGYRSGLPNTYHFTGAGLTGTVSSTSLSNSQTISYTIIAGNQNWTNSIDYSIGQQPLDSKGGNYNLPLSAGNSGNKTLSLEGVFPIFGSTSTISTQTKQSLVSMLTGNNVVLSLVSESGGNKQSFEIPNAFRSLVNVQTFNTVSAQYETTLLSNWTTSSVNETIQSNSISYTKYIYNGSDRAAVLIRLLF